MRSRRAIWLAILIIVGTTTLGAAVPPALGYVGCDWDIEGDSLLLSARPRLDTMYEDPGIVCRFGCFIDSRTNQEADDDGN